MEWPFISRKKHEAEMLALQRSISKVCNTGCRTAKCVGKVRDSDLGITKKKTVGHTYAPIGKRVRVTQHDGTQFVAKFKGKEGRFHVFADHEKVKSSLVRQLSILTADYKEET